MRFKVFTAICLALAAPRAGGLKAQEAAPTVKVDVKDVKIQDQKTPMFAATGIKDKNWRQKTWLELDMTIDAKKVKTKNDTSTMIDSLQVKFFIALNQMEAGKNFLLTGTMTVQNVPAKTAEHSHVLAYVSPSTLRRLLGDSKQFTAGDIKAIAVEINFGGQIVGGHSTVPTAPGKRWWEITEGFSVIDGQILPKSKTPFAPLWGDYDVDVKAN